MISNRNRLRVLLVPDSVHWVTGTIAKNIARYNPWIEATIASGPVIDKVFAERPELMKNFDLVHFICPYASKEWLPRFRDAVPCVTSHHHTSDWELLKHNLDGDAIIVGSPEWSEDLVSRGADLTKVFCVPYGVDAEEFKPVSVAQRGSIRTKLRISNGTTTIGFFGKNSSNECDRKGIDVFTEALLSLSRRLPEMSVLIVGPGWQDLVSSLQASGLACLWFPYIRDLAGLAEMYRALDFYWVTARVEGGPVTLLEAMSTEVCCLTTAVGIAREIVTDGENAVLLPFDDPEAFAERTAGLAADERERKRLGDNARKTILERMHVGVTTSGVRAVYTKAFENFAARQQCLILFDVAKIAEGFAPPPSANKGIKNSETPLNGFPRTIHRRVKMLESLAFAENLMLYHRQRAAGLNLILRQQLTNPFSLMPLRTVLRRFLPASMVARVVKLKNRLRSTPELVAH
jgi:glycosyltransferase involved in cell wall biosynthesis